MAIDRDRRHRITLDDGNLVGGSIGDRADRESGLLVIGRRRNGHRAWGFVAAKHMPDGGVAAGRPDIDGVPGYADGCIVVRGVRGTVEDLQAFAGHAVAPTTAFL